VTNDLAGDFDSDCDASLTDGVFAVVAGNLFAIDVFVLDVVTDTVDVLGLTSVDGANDFNVEALDTLEGLA
jgi:hypothetical protein